MRFAPTFSTQVRLACMALTAVVAALAVGACRGAADPGGAGLRVEVTAPEVRAGQSVVVRATNETDHAVEYTECAEFDQQVGAMWVPAPISAEYATCTSVLRSAPPGATVEFSRGVPPDFTPGVYRVRVCAISGGVSVSDAFTVLAP